MYKTENLSVASLIFYANHPFKLYEGKRLDDMVESIREHKIIVPIIVRPVEGEKDKYEILSGHNRVNAAKEAGLDEVPAVIRNDIDDDTAKLIVTETNLIQRSFADLSHCERAAVLEAHYSALKKKDTDNAVLKEIEEILSPVGTKTKSVRDVGNEYSLSKNTVARYLRISKLIPELKAMLDEERNGKKLPFRIAVSLSYLRDEEQQIVNELLSDTEYSINMRKADALREKSETDGLSEEDVKRLLADTPKGVKGRSVKIKDSIYSKYFSNDNSKDDVSGIIEQALQLWFEGKNENA